MSLPELTVGEVNYNSIELRWDTSENNNSNNNKKRKLFHVQLNRARARSPCPGGPSLDPLTNYQGFSVQYVFKGLEPMTQYLCRLRVMDDGNGGQGGGWSEPITVCTANEPPSGAELHKAVSKQELEKVRSILEENSTVVEVMDKFGLTPLMVAAQKGFTGEIIDYKYRRISLRFVNTFELCKLAVMQIANDEEVIYFVEQVSKSKLRLNRWRN